MNMQAIFERAARNGSVRLTVGACNKQAQLTFWPNEHHASEVIELRGELNDVLLDCAAALGIDSEGKSL